MHYFIDAAENVYAFASTAEAPEGLFPINEAEALALAAGSPPEVDYPALIAATRYEHETAGITLEGMVIDTGRDSQGLITGAVVQAMLDPSYTLNWKTAVGFVQLTAAQIIGIATAVRAHVQACFDREAMLLVALQDGSFAPEMLSEGWPI